MAGRYRLYVDESGHASPKSASNPRYRYLGLTGVIMTVADHDGPASRDFDTLRRKHFPTNEDDPVILVRNDLVRRTGPFHVLTDPTANSLWEREIMEYIQTWGTDPITVVIDQQLTLERFGERDEDAYLRAMRYMLQRYRGWLVVNDGVGDVLTESRGKDEDRRLRRAYEHIYQRGDGRFLSAADMQAVLTTRKLKIDRKTEDITGLQVADLLANPMKRGVLQDFRGEPRAPGTFTQRLIETMKPHYHRANRFLYPK